VTTELATRLGHGARFTAEPRAVAGNARVAGMGGRSGRTMRLGARVPHDGGARVPHDDGERGEAPA
jgi:hypothetical protein